MKSKAVTIILALLCLSAFLGWFKASDSGAEQASRSDNWDSLVKDSIMHPDYAEVSSHIRRSGILPVSKKDKKNQSELGGISQINVTGDVQVPGFPDIIATAIIDGKPQVTLNLEDKTVLSIRSGDILYNGWEIVDIELVTVIAAFDGEEYEFPVLPYDRHEGRDKLDENKN